eukprot:1659006-Rhodomonas_salina.5
MIQLQLKAMMRDSFAATMVYTVCFAGERPCTERRQHRCDERRQTHSNANVSLGMLCECKRDIRLEVRVKRTRDRGRGMNREEGQYLPPGDEREGLGLLFIVNRGKGRNHLGALKAKGVSVFLQLLVVTSKNPAEVAVQGGSAGVAVLLWIVD